MLSETRQQQFIAFANDFVALLAEHTDITREQVPCVAIIAASALLGTILCEPCNESTHNYVTSVLKAAIKKFYGEVGS